MPVAGEHMEFFSRACIAPVLPLRDVLVFPDLKRPLFVGRERSLRALQVAMHDKKGRHIVLLAQRQGDIDDPGAADLNEIGTLGSVFDLTPQQDGSARVIIGAVQRVRVLHLDCGGPCLTAAYKPVSEGEEAALVVKAYRNALGAALSSGVSVTASLEALLCMHLTAEDRVAVAAELRQALLRLRKGGDQEGKTSLERAEAIHTRQEIARWLLRLDQTGALTPEDLAPWDATHLHWRLNGISLAEAAARLAEANALDAPDQDRALEQQVDLESAVSELFLRIGDRGVALRIGNEEHRHDETIATLLGLVRPRLDAVSVDQTENGDIWEIKLGYGGRSYCFAGQLGEPELEADCEVVNQFMAIIGRPERVFRLDGSNGYYDICFCANQQSFSEINRRLRLPLFSPRNPVHIACRAE